MRNRIIGNEIESFSTYYGTNLTGYLYYPPDIYGLFFTYHLRSYLGLVNVVTN